MCLLLLAYRSVPGHPVVLAANRDEFHERPTDPAAWWAEPPILAGYDREAGGTWLAVRTDGAFAAVTNYRDPSAPAPGRPSRGGLPVAALAAPDLAAYIAGLAEEGERYAGFNLLAGDARDLHYVSNRGPGPRRLEPGLYALSNGVLDAPWPKAERGRALMAAALERHGPDPEALFAVLFDRHVPPDEALPDTGVERDWERLLASIFIVSPRYGTRCSTVYRLADDGSAYFEERRFDRRGRFRGDRRERFLATA